MKKKVKTIIWIIVVIIFAYLYAHIGKTHMIYDKHIDSSDYISTGIVEGTIEQEFVCVEDTLDGITAKCSLQGDVSGVSVKASLYDGETEEKVAEAELKAEDIKNSKFNIFKFNTIKGCKGKVYRVIFENIDADVENNSGISLSYQPFLEKNTHLKINNKEIEGTLIIKTVTNRFDMETMCVLLIFIVYIVFFVKFLYKLFK